MVVGGYDLGVYVRGGVMSTIHKCYKSHYTASFWRVLSYWLYVYVYITKAYITIAIRLRYDYDTTTTKN